MLMKRRDAKALEPRSWMLSKWPHASGFRHLYLETHSNLKAALRLYEHLGFDLIERPSFVKHSTMDRFFFKDISENE